eukprot:1265339-Amphidinium_carterae.2
MLASCAPQAINLGQERDGPALPGLTRSNFRELEIEHFTKLLRPNPRREELEFTHAPSIRATRLTSRTSLDNLADRAGTPSTIGSSVTTLLSRTQPGRQSLLQ